MNVARVAAGLRVFFHWAAVIKATYMKLWSQQANESH